MGESKEYSSIVDLRKSILIEWENIRQEEVQTHIKNLFEKRLDACIDADGDYF